MERAPHVRTVTAAGSTQESKLNQHSAALRLTGFEKQRFSQRIVPMPRPLAPPAGASFPSPHSRRKKATLADSRDMCCSTSTTSSSTPECMQGAGGIQLCAGPDLLSTSACADTMIEILCTQQLQHRQRRAAQCRDGSNGKASDRHKKSFCAPFYEVQVS